MQTYLHTRSRRAPRWSRCSCGRRWVWSGWLSSGSGPVWRSDPWAGDWGTAAPSSSGSGGSLSGSPRCPGPPVHFDSQPSPRFRPQANSPKTQGMKGLTSDGEKPGSLENSPPSAVRYPMRSDTAAQPGERAMCSVCVLMLYPLQRLIIQMYRFANQVTTLWSKRHQFSPKCDAVNPW